MSQEKQMKEITRVEFGVLSSKEIINMSVAEIFNPKKYGENSVYDERLGTTNSSKECITCQLRADKCPGHFGHIILNEPVIHPFYYKHVLNYLRIFCNKCFKILLPEEQIELYNFKKDKFKKILEKSRKISKCCRTECGMSQCTYKFTHTNSTIHKIYENEKGEKIDLLLSTREILSIFDNISDDDIRLLGYDPSFMHPRNFIITVLPVLPPNDRPYVNADGNMCDDDITIQLCEIIKLNNYLSDKIRKKKNISENRRQKLIVTLTFRINTMFNNSQGKSKHSTNGRPIKGFKERLSGKDGQFRNNILGRRCNYTGRTVIGPDSTLKLNELVMPVKMAENLSVPVRVSNMNIEYLEKLTNENGVLSLLKPDMKTRINIQRYRIGTRTRNGDIIHREDQRIKVITGRELLQEGDLLERDGKILDKVIPANRHYKLKMGWIVERKLQDGDYVILNRQPTLHSGSMMAMKIKILKGKTLRFNLASTKSFNADYDGDEMNIHAPQSLEAICELKYLSSNLEHIISHQTGKPNIVIVQDALLASYLMTKGIKKLTKSQFFDGVCRLELTDSISDRIQHIRRVLRSKNKKAQAFTGKGLFSMFLPKDFNYEHKNNASTEEPIVKIYKGVLYEGTLTKSNLGSSHQSIIKILHKEYGTSVTSNFIDCVQFIGNYWLTIFGFTIGLSDCLLSDYKKEKEISNSIKKYYIEADVLSKINSNNTIKEIRISASLNKAKDVGLKIAKESIDKQNGFLDTINSGAKGDFFNICQITGLLGQQNLKGKRVQYSLNNKQRSLPHYPLNIECNTMKYESKGFIKSSFIKGLNPREFYIHSMSGREGVSDTALGTSTSGYIFRRMAKLMEDITVQYDQTVRDTQNNLYQLYFNNNIKPTSIMKVDNRDTFCNVQRIVDKLNLRTARERVKLARNSVPLRSTA